MAQEEGKQPRPGPLAETPSGALGSGWVTPRSCPCRGPDPPSLVEERLPWGQRPLGAPGLCACRRGASHHPSAAPQGKAAARGETPGGRLRRASQGAWERGQSTNAVRWRVLFETLSLGSMWEPTIICRYSLRQCYRTCAGPGVWQGARPQQTRLCLRDSHSRDRGATGGSEHSAGRTVLGRTRADAGGRVGGRLECG